MNANKTDKLFVIGFILNFCITFALIWAVGSLWVLQFEEKQSASQTSATSLAENGMIPRDQLAGESLIASRTQTTPSAAADSDSGVYRIIHIGMTANGFSPTAFSVVYSDAVKITIANYDTVARTIAYDAADGSRVDGGTIAANQEKTLYFGGFENAERMVTFYSARANAPQAELTATMKICN